MKFVLTTICLVFLSHSADAQIIINTGVGRAEVERIDRTNDEQQREIEELRAEVEFLEQLKSPPPIGDPTDKESLTVAVKASKPIVIGNKPDFPCPACNAAQLAIEKHADSLPFRVVWRVNTGLQSHYRNPNISYPAFEFPRKDGRMWCTFGKNLKQLEELWALQSDTDAERYAKMTSVYLGEQVPVPDLSAAKPEPNKRMEMVCGCQGRKPGCCLCLQEIRAGIRTKGCTCSATKGSVHVVSSLTSPWKPLGATGEYKTIGGSKAACQKCGKVH